MNRKKQKRFHGKFRGVVTVNQDPEMRGRIMAQVPDVTGASASGWAMPCVPYAGNGVGLFLVPPIGASVWIEFEQGDPDFPIWTGCFWSEGAPPVLPNRKVLKTNSATITLDDTPGNEALILKTVGGQKIKLSATGIVIDSGSGAIIKLAGPTVSINGEAMEIT